MPPSTSNSRHKSSISEKATTKATLQPTRIPDNKRHHYIAFSRQNSGFFSNNRRSQKQGTLKRGFLKRPIFSEILTSAHSWSKTTPLHCIFKFNFFTKGNKQATIQATSKIADFPPLFKGRPTRCESWDYWLCRKPVSELKNWAFPRAHPFTKDDFFIATKFSSRIFLPNLISNPNSYFRK